MYSVVLLPHHINLVLYFCTLYMYTCGVHAKINVYIFHRTKRKTIQKPKLETQKVDKTRRTVSHTTPHHLTEIGQECLDFCSWRKSLSARVKSSWSSSMVLLESSGAADTCLGLALEGLTVGEPFPNTSTDFASW